MGGGKFISLNNYEVNMYLTKENEKLESHHQNTTNIGTWMYFLVFS